MKQTTRPQTNQQPSKIANRGRLRRFVFTLNNWTEDELASIKEYPCKWMIIGKETGKEGTPHLQGACVIGKQVSFSTIKKYPGFTRAHIERMNGKPSDSLTYCSKEDGHPFMKGTLPAPGKRNDIDTVVERMKGGETIGQIVQDPQSTSISAIVRYSRGFQYVSTLLMKDRTEPPTVIWLYGPTGLGKTRCALELSTLICPSRPAWMSAGSLRWFDGYSGQPIAIFDDLRTKHASFDFLLRLLDRYPMRVEIKGATVTWVPQFIFVTAPKSPGEMWNLRTPEDINQLERRVTHSIDVSIFGDYKELLHKLHSILGLIEEEEEPSESWVPRDIIDLTDGISSSGSGVSSSELDLIEVSTEEDEQFDNLPVLFSEADKAFNK